MKKSVLKKMYFLLAVASGTCWGTYGTFSSALMDAGIESATISMIVPLFYGLFFFVLLCLDDIRKIIVSKRMFLFLICAGLCSSVFNFSTVQAYSYLPFGIVSTVIYCNLFLLMVFSRILFKDKITKEKCIAAVLAVLGIGMLLNIFSLEMNFSMTGLFWTFVAMIFWALPVTLEKYILVQGVDSNAVMVYMGFFALVFLSLFHSPVKAVGDIVSAVSFGGAGTALNLLGFAFLTAVGAYFFYMMALKRMESSYVQLGFVMDPLTSTVLGLVLFGQTLLPVQFCGIALILFVVAWVQWTEIKKVKTE